MEIEIRYRPARDQPIGDGETWPMPGWVRIRDRSRSMAAEMTEIPLATLVKLGATKQSPRELIYFSAALDDAGEAIAEPMITRLLGADVWNQILELIELGDKANRRFECTPPPAGKQVLDELAAAVEESRLVAMPYSEEDMQLAAIVTIASLIEMSRNDPERAKRIYRRIMEED